MKDINIEYVYKNLTQKKKQEVVELWTSNVVVSLSEAQRRVDEVSCLIYRNSTLVGVSTVYKNDFNKKNNPYFFYRMFIREDDRGSNALRTAVMRENFLKLKESYSDSVNGLVVELENIKLARLGSKTSYFTKRGWTYSSLSNRGLQLWFVRFDEPKGIFV